MRKKIAVSCILISLLCACGSQDDNALSTGEAVTSRQVSLTKDQESPHCEVSLKLHYVKGSGSKNQVAKSINESVTDRLFFMRDLTMQQAADSFANQYTRDYVRNCLPLYRDDSDDPQKSAWYEYRYSITTETKHERSNTLTYLATIDYYEGGAHGINQLIIMNFNTTDGQQLTLSDLFIPGYEQQLNELLLNALMEKTGTTTMEQLHEKGYLFAMNIFPPENFILGKDDITFVYNPYEIAPYAMGKTELTLSNSELKSIMNSDGTD